MTSGRIERALATSMPFWIEEFEIGFRAFSASDIYRETGWLTIQIAKEWTGSGVYGPAGVDVESANADAPQDKLDEELSHHRGLVELGRVMDAPPLQIVANPVGDALVSLRNRLWDDPVARLAVAMSEGGGLGMFAGALAAIAARSEPLSQDAAVAQCFGAIITDEAGHVAGGFAAFAAATLTMEHEEAIYRHLADILALKVAERQGQFAPQLTATFAIAPSALVQATGAYRAFASTRFTAP